MILSGKEIESRVGGDIIIDPFDKKRINPNSYNLSLHNKLITYKEPQLDMKKDNEVEELTVPSEGLILESNRLFLGRTIEYTETKKFSSDAWGQVFNWSAWPFCTCNSWFW